MSRLRRGEERFALSICRVRQAVDLLITSLRQDGDNDTEGRDGSHPPFFPHPGCLLDPSSPKAVDTASSLYEGSSGRPGFLAETGKAGPGVSPHAAQMGDIVTASMKGEENDTDSGGDHHHHHHQNHNHNNNSNINSGAETAGPATAIGENHVNEASCAVAVCSTRNDMLESAEESSDDDTGDNDMVGSLITSILEARSRVLKLRVKLATAIKRATMGRSGK